MTIATLKDLIIGSEDYDEELTKNIHSTIVEDRKVREENLRIEEQKRKKNYALKNEKKITLRTIEKSFDNYLSLTKKAPERTWIDFYHELNTYFNGWIDGLKIDTFNKLSDLIITDQLKRKTPFEFKEYYLDEWANMNSPVQLAEKIEEFEDFKKTLKQKSSSPFVKKQEYKFTEKNCRYEDQENSSITGKIRSFQRQRITTNITKPLLPSTNLFKDIKTARRKGITTKITRNTQITMLPSICSDELFKIAEIQRTSKRNLHTHR
ncbi:uncharacterized protein TNCV_328731 [Trichonephila clavipes]|nr:uncharacterized protein TNCV_328731 [Trichonephila clavipes]